jgi:hypothetical protein
MYRIHEVVAASQSVGRITVIPEGQSNRFKCNLAIMFLEACSFDGKLLINFDLF